MVDNKLLNIAFKIKRANNREKIFMALAEPMMPSELVRKIYNKNSNTYFVIVSRALIELKKLKVIKIINPKEKTGRVYKITNLGKKIKKLLK